MNRILAALAAGLLVFAAASSARADSFYTPGGSLVQGVVPMVLCANGAATCVPVGPSNPMPVAGSFSASLAGFTPTPSYSQLAASDALNHSVAAPSGADDVISNLDTNLAYCNFGAASTTATFPVPAGASFGFHNGGAFSTIQCQSPTSTLKITISGGAGLFSGGGGGGGGGGGTGGTVAQGAGNSATPWTVSPCTGCVFPAQQNGNWTAFTANLGGAASLTPSASTQAAVNIATASTTLLVSGVAGKNIYVTAADFVVSAAATANQTIQLVYGTQTTTACDTGQTAVSPAYTLSAGTGVAKGSGQGAIYTIPAGDQICAVTGAAQPIAVSLSLTQY